MYTHLMKHNWQIELLFQKLSSLTFEIELWLSSQRVCLSCNGHQSTQLVDTRDTFHRSNAPKRRQQSPKNHVQSQATFECEWNQITFTSKTFAVRRRCRLSIHLFGAGAGAGGGGWWAFPLLPQHSRHCVRASKQACERKNERVNERVTVVRWWCFSNLPFI